MPGNFLVKVKDQFEVNDSKKKIENAVLFLILLVLVVVVLNNLWNKKQTNKPINNAVLVNSTDVSKDIIEEKLKNILTQIKGVGICNVMITYINDSQRIPMYDVKEGETVTQEKDKEGGVRTVTQKDVEKQVIYQDNNGQKVPVIEKSIMAKVAGVIIVAQGASDGEIKNNIIKAVCAVTELPPHKVQVFSR